MIRAFRKYAVPEFANNGHGMMMRDATVWEWLTVAQHHGLPTRLLDWTHNPMIAAHFVTDRPEDLGTDGAIWCVEPGELNARSEEFRRWNLSRPQGAKVLGLFTIEQLEEYCHDCGGCPRQLIVFVACRHCFSRSRLLVSPFCSAEARAAREPHLVTRNVRRHAAAMRFSGAAVHRRAPGAPAGAVFGAVAGDRHGGAADVAPVLRPQNHRARLAQARSARQAGRHRRVGAHAVPRPGWAVHLAAALLHKGARWCYEHLFVRWWLLVRRSGCLMRLRTAALRCVALAPSCCSAGRATGGSTRAGRLPSGRGSARGARTHRPHGPRRTRPQRRWRAERCVWRRRACARRGRGTRTTTTKRRLLASMALRRTSPSWASRWPRRLRGTEAAGAPARTLPWRWCTWSGRTRAAPRWLGETGCEAVCGLALGSPAKLCQICLFTTPRVALLTARRSCAPPPRGWRRIALWTDSARQRTAAPPPQSCPCFPAAAPRGWPPQPRRRRRCRP